MMKFDFLVTFRHKLYQRVQVIVIDGGVKHVISYIREEVQVGQIVQNSSPQNGWEFFTSGKLSLHFSVSKHTRTTDSDAF